MKRVLIAGGQCGTTMLRARGLIKDECERQGIDVSVDVNNLWESTYVKPNYNLVIEMFPFFEDMYCPLLSGKPFINRLNEKELIQEIVKIIN